MNLNPARTMLATMVAMLVAVSVLETGSAQSSSPTAPQASPKALLLEKNEGERRIWRDLPPGEFILKVSPKNNGSQHLVLGTEDLTPGDEIPTHKHLDQDEIVWIEKGTLHVHVGDQERDLHAGGMAFIPAHTWVSAKNTGTDTASLVFVFSAPGFENLMRCESRLPDEKPAPITSEEYKECEHQGHVIYKEPEWKPQK